MLRFFSKSKTAIARANRRSFATDTASSGQKLQKILVANRGEIAVRVLRSAQKLNIETVAVYSDADANAQHVQLATEAYRLGPAPAAESYLDYKKILDVCKLSGAQAVHPGYGFLSENADFAKACADAGIEFIGPPVDAIQAMGSKSASKDIMIKAGVPVTPGYHGDDQSLDTLQKEAEKIGYPLLIKAVLGGGGKGMRIVHEPKDFQEMLDACQREAQASFSDKRVLLEKYLVKPRHVELQIFGDKHGNAVHLFERDCSVQRRHQKVLEEAPAPHMSEQLRKKMGDAAVAAAKAVGYVGAGTVEFLLDEDESFYFMEMNTRLQVEHPVTEMVTQRDLVELQLHVASGAPLPFTQDDVKLHGHAIEARVYAENPYNDFLPGSGQLQHLRLPELSDNVRVDTGIVQGDEVSIFYDPMIAKVIAKGENRQVALDRLVKALHQYQIVGLPTNIEFVARTAGHEEFQKGGVDTSFLNKYGDDVLQPLPAYSADVKALGAVALVLLEQQRQSVSSNSPWTDSSLSYFRSLDVFKRKLALGHEKEEVMAEVECLSKGSFKVSLDDASDSINIQGGIQANGDFRLVVGSRTYKGTAVVHKQELHIFCDDGSQRYKYAFDVPLPSLESTDGSASAGGLSKIVTPMPGKIIKVLVENGQEVAADDALVIVEAMKMEHVVRATRDGTVGTVECKDGDFVGDGHVLVQLE